MGRTATRTIAAERARITTVSLTGSARSRRNRTKKGLAMKSAVCLVGAILTVAVGAVGARAYDRQPIVLSGLYGDGWGNSTSKAERALLTRYAGIRTVWCEGVIMAEDRSSSSWLDGYTRYWDKLACGGYTRSGHQFALVYDAKAQYAWVIYRLRGVSEYGLRYG
jgi:hypothetical protein